ncbi:MAG: hypothetical protein U5M51_03945 [Emticicia sp.]|nr:hypothetical protein [Emticicia sp.]
MFTILRQAFRRTAQNWQIVLVIFLVNFALGLIIAFPSFSIIKAESEQSLAFEKLIKDFDFTVFYDFMHHNGKSLVSLIPISLLLTGLYTLLNIFFSGGILSQFTIRDTFKLGDFLKNSWHYFLRFFLLFLIQIVFLIIALIVTFALFGIFGAIADGKTEPTFIAWMIFPSVFAFYYITYLLNVGDYARVLLHRDDLLNPWKAFWKATDYVFRNFKTMQVYWAIVVVSFAVIMIYLMLESVIGMTSGFKIWLMFIIQQFFIFCRVFIRTWNLSNAFDFVSLRPIPLTPKPIIIEPEVIENTNEATATEEDTSSENKLSE